MFAPTYGAGFMSGMPMQPGLSETVINNYYNEDHASQHAADTGQNYADDRNTLPADYNDAQDPGQDFSNDDMGGDPGGDFSNDGGGYDD